MSDRTLKKSLSGKSNPPVDENNLDLFSLNRVLVKPGRHSFEKPQVAKREADDVKKHGNDLLHTIPEVPLGALSRLVLEARNVTSKVQPISTARAGSRSEIDPSSRPTRSSSAIRSSNIPTIRSVSAPKKTTTTTTTSASASVPSPKRSVSRSLTPTSRKIPSRSLTPSRNSTTTSTTPSLKQARDAKRSRSLTPKSKPLIEANPSRTQLRSVAVSSRPDQCSSVSATPRTPPRLKESVTLAFGRPVVKPGSPKRNTSPDVTRTRPKGRSASPSMIPTISSVSHTTTTPKSNPKSVKPSPTSADSTKSGKKLSKASVQMAINHLDVARNGKVGTHAFSSTMLYPHSIRSSSSGLRKQSGSEGSSSSNQEDEEGRSLIKEGNTENINDSARYDALLNVRDVKDTNWLLNIDDDFGNHSLIFDNAFDSPPDLFPHH